jgi:methionyl aminopeptidase
VGGAIQDLVEAAGFSVVRDYVGHGVGRKLHEEPQIPHYRTGTPGAFLRDGEAIAIEPMVNVGTYEVRTKGNKWTVVTQDGALSAHFEHTIIVRDGAAEIMTCL